MPMGDSRRSTYQDSSVHAEDADHSSLPRSVLLVASILVLVLLIILMITSVPGVDQPATSCDPMQTQEECKAWP